MTQRQVTRATRIRRSQGTEVLLPTVLPFPFVAVYFAAPLNLLALMGLAFTWSLAFSLTLEVLNSGKGAYE